MSALERQQKILKDCAKENKNALKKYHELIKSGHYITMEGSIVGPYTTKSSYYFSDGSFITIVSAANLSWSYKIPSYYV